jgi:hypothetical protein
MTQSVPTFRKSTDKEANAMASNDVEVLDPATTVEKVKELVSERVLNRRNFITALGVAGAAAGTGLVSAPSAEAQQPVGTGGYAQVDVLNLMLNLKYLKATLYSYITQGADLPAASMTTVGTGTMYNAPTKITFTNPQITDLFNEMYYDELNQLITLRNLQGTAVAPRATINLLGSGLLPAPPATTTITQSQAISLARMLEDLSAQAFATASIYLTGTNLAFANQALAVDGFHAGAIRLIAIQTGAPYQSTQMSGTTTSSTETNTTFPGSTSAGSPVIYAFLGSVIPVVGNILSGIGIPPGAGAAITSITNTPSATPTLIPVSGSPILNTVSSVAGLLPGQPITGTGIPALSYITVVGTNTITISQNATVSVTVKPTGIVTSGSAVITNVSSLSGVLVGQPITGTGIPTTPPTTITAASGTTITMSANGTASSVVKPTGVLTNGSATITSVSSLTGIIVGQPISGTGIPAGATVTGTGTNSITMSVAATANSALTTAFTFTAITVAGSNIVTPTGAFGGLVIGQTLTGAGIPAGTTITFLGTATVTLSANATVSSIATPTGITTAGSAVLTAVSSLAGLVAGQVISGPGIVAGTTIVSSTGTTITMSGAATVTSSSAVTFSSPSAVTLSTTTGPALSSPTTETVTTPTTETVTIGLSQVIIAGNATVTGINTISVLLADNFDVAPGDPGTAALAAAGPAAIPGISPAIYQGFFDTAGAATNSANNPPGFVFARSFQQILAVLYNFNPTTSANTTGNYTGGFFPYGVSGPINNANG